jgi:hypothetical protein
VKRAKPNRKPRPKVWEKKLNFEKKKKLATTGLVLSRVGKFWNTV